MTLSTAFIGYRVHRGPYTIVGKTSYILVRLTKARLAFPRIICDSVHNSRKKQLYTCLAYESRPSLFTYCDSAHNLREQAFVFLCIVSLML